MAHQKTKKTLKLLIYVMPILLLALSFPLTAQMIKAQTTSTPWALKLQVLNDQNTTAGVFQPFDQVQLLAKVTYNNASQPDVLVSFEIVGPSSNPINIARTETTKANGEATFSFRLPIQANNEDSLIGTWNVTATVNGAKTQTSSFITQWGLEATSINLLNSQGQNQTIFSPGDNVAVDATINNLGQSQMANVTLNIQDSDQIINQTEILNSQIPSLNQTQIQATLQIPENAPAGQAAINLALYNGAYNGTDIPAGENQTAYFTVINNGTTTPTPAPTSPTPTPPPTVLQNSVSLFSWLLVATGLFTFTMLYMFLRRKPTQMGPLGPQMPNMPTINPYPTATPPSDPIQPKPTTQEPQQIAAKIGGAPNMVQATTTTQMPAIFETWSSQDPSDTDTQNKQVSKPSMLPESSQDIPTYLSRISETGKKVQALETSLKAEREQLNQQILGLNQILEEQERAVRNYFDSIRQALAAMNTQTAEVKGVSDSRPIDANNGNTTLNATISTQPLPANDTQNIQSKQQNIGDKSVKEQQFKIRTQERTQEEDIRIAEHTKED